MSEPTGVCAAAWAACTTAGPRARPDPRQLARALLHAAGSGFCRTAWWSGDDEDAPARAAARVFCLLQIALRTGGYDPAAPGEGPVWATLLRALPADWVAALEGAARARPRRRGSPVIAELRPG